MSFKIVFMGTPSFAVPILKSINNSYHKILKVYSQPPKEKNRGQKIENSPIHDYAIKLNIPVRCPKSFDDNEEIDHIKKLKPDVVVVVAYGKIIPPQLMLINPSSSNFSISLSVNPPSGPIAIERLSTFFKSLMDLAALGFNTIFKESLELCAQDINSFE